MLFYFFSSFKLWKYNYNSDLPLLFLSRLTPIVTWTQATFYHFTKLLSNTSPAFYASLGSFCQYNLSCMGADLLICPERAASRWCKFPIVQLNSRVWSQTYFSQRFFSETRHCKIYPSLCSLICGFIFYIHGSGELSSYPDTVWQSTGKYQPKFAVFPGDWCPSHVVQIL